MVNVSVAKQMSLPAKPAVKKGSKKSTVRGVLGRKQDHTDSKGGSGEIDGLSSQTDDRSNQPCVGSCWAYV